MSDPFACTTYREITTHRVPGGAAEGVKIKVVDEPGAGGANHHYLITHPGGQQNCRNSEIIFQKGPIPDAGLNGCTNESLIAVVMDRLAAFQAGLFACEENATALTALQAALDALHARTNARMVRGVEGSLTA